MNGRGRDQEPPRLTLEQAIERRFVMPGWTREAWANELRRKAEKCAGLNRQVSDAYTRWAEALAPQRPDSAPPAGGEFRGT